MTRNHPDLPHDAPWRFGFFGLMRWLSARHADLPPAGEAERPQQEIFRLGQQPSMIFAPREIAGIERGEEGWRIRLFGLGLLGANGPLPLHLTDFIRERSEAQQDRTLEDFLNIFHHRYLSILYRAWASSQSTAGLDRADDERFSVYVNALGACEAGEHGALPAHALLAASAHLVREARNPDGLAATLSHFFGVPARVEEFVARWIDINPEDCTRLGNPGLPGMLGEGAFAGEKILDRQHHFRLVIGPLSLDDYLSFTPTGHNLPLLVEWVRAFTGFEFAWEAELRIAPQAAPAACLGGEERLGWSTWLGQPEAATETSGMVFEPEVLFGISSPSYACA